MSNGNGKLKFPEQPKFDSPLDQMGDLDLVSRVQAVVGETLNPGGNQKAMKKMEKDVRDLSKLVEPPKLKIKAAKADTDDAALSDSLEADVQSDSDEVLNPPKPKDKDVVHFGSTIFNRDFMEQVIQGKKKKPKNYNKHTDDTDAIGELPARRRKMEEPDPETQDMRGDAADNAAKMARAIRFTRIDDSAPDVLKKEALLMSFVAGIIKEADAELNLDESRPEIFGSFVRGLYDSGITKSAQFRHLDAPLRKAAAASLPEIDRVLRRTA